MKIRKIMRRVGRAFEGAVCKFLPPVGRWLFLRAWTRTLSDSAALYSGLYSGLVRVQAGGARAPHKTLKEWYDRTRFRWEDGDITFLSGRTLGPAIEREDAAACARWAGLLLKAAENAGIAAEPSKSLVLDENSAAAYAEFGGEELFVGDAVEVLRPAWYQRGKIVEAGTCRLSADREE